MNKWSKEEVSLCKQVAEKHRKDVSKGDWWHRNKGNYPTEIVLVQRSGSADLFNDINKHARLHSHGFPLWTISDCLEFLREKDYRLCLGTEERTSQIWTFSFVNMNKHLNDNFYITGNGKTPLTACLKAVLAVLEETK